jgi:hypothetical protein
MRHPDEMPFQDISPGIKPNTKLSEQIDDQDSTKPMNPSYQEIHNPIQ